MAADRKSRTLAWVLGGGGAVACGATFAATLAVGLGSEELLVLLTFILSGLLGALVASRAPANPIGWLMCAASLEAVTLFAPLDYGYAAEIKRHGAWPLGGVALWLGAWTWAPVVGLFLPLLTARFPDGRRPARWRAFSWMAAGATLIFAAGVALGPPDVVSQFVLVPPGTHPEIAPHIHNPLGAPLSSQVSAWIADAGLTLIVLIYGASVAFVVDRYRQARGDERLQLKWFSYAGILTIAASLFATAVGFLGVVPPTALDVLVHASFLALPAAIAIAILRYRLYDIDLIINRTVIYGSLTAILTALYTAGVALLNRVFVAVSGQKSDAAYLIGTFVVVVAFSPVRDWLQRQVNRRVSHDSPSAALDQFRTQVDAVVSVFDVNRVACRLLDQAVDAYAARGAALYLRSHEPSRPLYTRGQLNGDPAVEVTLQYGDREFGRLVLGDRRGGVAYTERDRAELQRSADVVAAALALAAHLGFQPMSTTR